MNLLSDEDIKRIISRDPELEIARLWDGGLRWSEHKHWSWETKYKLNFSMPGTGAELESAYQAGMLKKSQLKNTQYYWGITRHGRVAMWSEEFDKFLYQRKKIGRWFVELAPHPDDERFGQNFFIPWLQIEPLQHEVITQLPERLS